MLTKIFSEIYDFCKTNSKDFEINLLSKEKRKRNKFSRLHVSEILTICIYFHYSGYKNFKNYYNYFVIKMLNNDFKNLVSYNRFLELKNKYTNVLYLFLKNISNKCNGINYIDSFSLEICNIKRRYSNKIFKNIANIGKTSVKWFFGFKLHTVINNNGDLIDFFISPGNIADNNEKIIKKITKNLNGYVFGDKGYLLNSKLNKYLENEGIKFVTKGRKNMKNKKLSEFEENFLSKRGLVESFGNILKNFFSLEHSRHRSFVGFFQNIFSCLSAYYFKEKKPSIKDFISDFISIS